MLIQAVVPHLHVKDSKLHLVGQHVDSSATLCAFRWPLLSRSVFVLLFGTYGQLHQALNGMRLLMAVSPVLTFPRA